MEGIGLSDLVLLAGLFLPAHCLARYELLKSLAFFLLSFLCAISSLIVHTLLAVFFRDIVYPLTEGSLA
jgi:hypothetical protein